MLGLGRATTSNGFYLKPPAFQTQCFDHSVGQGSRQFLQHKLPHEMLNRKTFFNCVGKNIHKTVANIYNYMHIPCMDCLSTHGCNRVMFCSRCRQLQDACFRIGFATLRSTFQKGVVFNRTKGFPWLWLLQAPWTAFVLDLLVSSSVLITSFSARLVQEIIGFPDSRGCVLNTNADHETLGCFRFDLAVKLAPQNQCLTGLFVALEWKL